MSSATHRYHPDTMSGDPEDAVLYDDCERCDEHAKDLRELDTDQLKRIRYRHRTGIQTITANERRARNLIDDAYQIVLRVGPPSANAVVNPGTPPHGEFDDNDDEGWRP